MCVGVKFFPTLAFSMEYAFEKQDFINLDEFSGHRLLYLIGMKTNSIGIKKFLAECFRRKYPNDSFWIPVLKGRGLI